MSEIKAGLDTIEQAIYESLGLILPGAVALLGAASVIAPDAVLPLAQAAGTHRWFAVGAAYLSGYLVQSASRPVTNFTRTVFGFPRALIGSVARKLAPSEAAWVSQALARAKEWLTDGHRAKHEPHDEETVRLWELAREWWTTRLRLEPGRRLRGRDAVDLCFSALGAEQRRLHRFRAITSLCRAMAAICALAFWGLLSLAVGPWWPVTLTGFLALLAFGLAFWGFMERANMYDRLWNGIVPAQFLVDVSVGSRASPAGAEPALSAAESATAVLASRVTRDTRDEAPSPIHTSGAQGTAPKTGNGGPRT